MGGIPSENNMNSRNVTSSRWPLYASESVFVEMTRIKTVPGECLPNTMVQDSLPCLLICSALVFNDLSIIFAQAKITRVTRYVFKVIADRKSVV